MHLIKSATITVENLTLSQSEYCRWLEYSVVETGNISRDLAKSWNAPKTAGAPYSVLQPASGANVFIRLIEQPPRDDYAPLISYGWTAIEICNQDTLAVNERMESSPFEIIGPPRELDGMPSIFPMQVKGANDEIIYLTEIRGDQPSYDLPRAQSFIDKLFILVLGCSDMEATGRWMETNLLLDQGTPIDMTYTMLSKAFEQPIETKYKISTLQHERDVFIQIDDLPLAAKPRARHEGMLPPGMSIGTFIHPEFDRVYEINKDLWVTPPTIRSGKVYDGKRTGTLMAPDGTLIEIIEA